MIIGAGGTIMPGWVSTDIDILNMCEFKSFSHIWPTPQITHFFAEHVWEHLDPVYAQAVKNCSGFLRPGGHLRIVAPDGNHADPKHTEYVRPGVTASGYDDNKHLFTASSLRGLLTKGSRVVVRPVISGSFPYERKHGAN